VLHRPQEQFLEPGVDIAETGLSGLEAELAGKDRAVHLTANAGHKMLLAPGQGGGDHVAGRGPHHLDEHVGLDTGPDGPEVGVEGADPDDDTVGQSEPLRPCGREHAGGPVAGEGVAIEPGPQAGQQGVETDQELLGGQSPPRFMPHRLVARGAAAALPGAGIAHAGQKRRNPVALLGPRKSRLAHLLILAQHMENFGPEPFGGVDPALVAGIVDAPPAFGEGVDLPGLADGGMVLPEHEHRVGIVGEFGLQGQGAPLQVDGAGG